MIGAFVFPDLWFADRDLVALAAGVHILVFGVSFLLFFVLLFSDFYFCLHYVLGNKTCYRPLGVEGLGVDGWERGRQPTQSRCTESGRHSVSWSGEV